MTHDIIRRWLNDFDKAMKNDGRRVRLLMENCSMHHIPDLEQTNVELQFFPPNCASLIQPLDQGINSVKCAYRWQLIDTLLLNLRSKRSTNVDIFQALKMLSAS